MSDTWFESIAEAQRRAKKRLPASVYSALIAGSEKGLTLKDNLDAFDELTFAPRTAGQSGERALATTVLGREIALPVLISPTGVQAVHPDGEVAVARAAAARGTALGLSSFASKPIEEVVAANPATFFQIYWTGSRDDILARLDRARRAGAAGLILTLDWSFSHSRDWGSPHIPEKLTFRELLRFAPEGLSRPRWLLDYVRTGRLPDLSVPNMAEPGTPSRPSSARTASGCRPRRRRGTTWPGCARSGTGRSCSRASSASTRPAGRWTPGSARSQCPTTAATTSTAPQRPSAPCRRSRKRWARTLRSCWTAASAVAATW